jgi:hypothetical protein
MVFLAQMKATRVNNAIDIGEIAARRLMHDDCTPYDRVALSRYHPTMAPQVADPSIPRPFSGSSVPGPESRVRALPP